MAFKDLELKDLLLTAEFFGVEVVFPEDLKTASAQKKFTIAALVEDGVSFEDYTKAFVREETVLDVDGRDLVQPVRGNKLVDPSEGVLLKMERENGTYEVRGYRFTREHPFAIVTEEDANFICSNIDGFKIALPAEAKAYYG